MVVQTLMRRGLYTTALENAKLLLSTNALTVSDVGEYNSASDCLDICLCIDYIALRAGHYTLLKVSLATALRCVNSITH